MDDFVLLIPVATTVMAAVFGTILWRHWNRKRQARYMLWWAIGVTAYGIGTFAEAYTSLFGWTDPAFRLWYIAGALLGGWPLAQGTVYLVLKKRTADILTTVSLSYVAIAATFVLLTPVDIGLVEEKRLAGAVMEWEWVRLFSPLLNLYAVIFLVGGALWSAWKYWRTHDRPGSRVWGNVFIAIGAILPGIGGSFARAGQVEVLYVTEILGLSLMWMGYWLMTKSTSKSIHRTQAALQTQD